MRAREVFVHAVDLGTGVTFGDMPHGFLASLTDEILVKRGMKQAPQGPLPKVTAYLAGRPHSLVNVPELGPGL